MIIHYFFNLWTKTPTSVVHLTLEIDIISEIWDSTIGLISNWTLLTIIISLYVSDTFLECWVLSCSVLLFQFFFNFATILNFSSLI